MPMAAGVFLLCNFPAATARPSRPLFCSRNMVIQRAEHRDTQAIHAKLDEMLHVMGEARNELTRVDEEEPEEIEERREEMRKDD
jgi:low affinity Fe/Cu permease